jgi:hypothetical protein
MIRWWLFKRLSELGWWVCPEPHRFNLKSVWGAKMNAWQKEVAADLKERRCAWCHKSYREPPIYCSVECERLDTAYWTLEHYKDA